MDFFRWFILVPALAIAAVSLIAYVASIALRDGYLFDPRGLLVGVDFVNSWTMAHFALTQENPQENYNLWHYTAQLRALFGPEYLLQQWSYPPSYMLLMLPLGLLPYTAAWAVAMLLNLALFLYVFRKVANGAWKEKLLSVLSGPAAIVGLISGQLALGFASLQLLFFHLLDRRPWLAGMVLGLLSVKPQLGLAYPFFLLATRRWQCFVAAALTVIALLLLSYFILGHAMWEAYFNIGIPLQREYALEHPTPIIRHMMPTVLMDLTSLGMTHQAALMVQAVLGVTAIASFFTPVFRRMDTPLQMLTVALVSVLATPYLMPYDLVFLAVCVVLYLTNAPVSLAMRSVCVACFWFPLLYFLASVTGVPGLSAIPLLTLGLILYTGGRRSPTA